MTILIETPNTCPGCSDYQLVSDPNVAVGTCSQCSASYVFKSLVPEPVIPENPPVG